MAAADVRASPSVWLNGAELRSDVQSLNGVGALAKTHLIYSANTNKLDGPFYWEFVAEGTLDEHVSMTVEGVQISTEKTRRKVVLPREMLGEANAFGYEVEEKPRFSFRKKAKPEPDKEKKWFASYRLPSKLQVFPKADGNVTLAAKITIESVTGSETEWVNFTLTPNANQSKSYTFRQTMIEYDGVPIE